MESDSGEASARRLECEGSGEPFRVQRATVGSAEHKPVIGEPGTHQQALVDHPLTVFP